MTMTRLMILCFGLIALCGCNINAIQGSGVSKTETRSVGAFSKIDLIGSPDVEVAVGPEVSLSVTADDNILPIIETKVEGDTLRIDTTNSYNTTLGVKLKITVPSLGGVSVSGSGNIQATGLKAGDMDASVTGSGNVTLSGVADGLRARVTGSGDLRAGELAAKQVRVNVTGSGNAVVRAAEELDATLTGSGNVRYSGHPPQVKQNVTGSGDISPL